MKRDQTLTEDRFWEAVQKRDATWDGKFFFGVLTTGVYCRPSCACRPPLRKNVRFFVNAADAESAGLRACLRCRPLETESAIAQRIRSVCEYIKAHQHLPLRLTDLAARIDLS